jgi:hypothetical protein
MSEDVYSSDLLAGMSSSMGQAPVHNKEELSANTNLRNIMSPDLAQDCMGKETLPKLYAEEEQADVSDGSYQLDITGDFIFAWDAPSGSTVPTDMTTTLPENPASGSGLYRAILYFIPEKAAFRAGSSFEDYDSYANIGLRSQSIGYKNKASGQDSIAFGITCQATNTEAMCFGLNNTASNEKSLAFGRDQTVSGYFSTGIGNVNTVSGDWSLSLGYRVDTTGDRAMTIGTGLLTDPFGDYVNSTANCIKLVTNNKFGVIISKGTSYCNYGFGTETWGTSADNAIAILNGTAPTTAVANVSQLFSKDTTEGTAKATLGLYTEHVPAVLGNSIGARVWWNGSERIIPLLRKDTTGTTAVAAATYAVKAYDQILDVTYTATGAVTITLDTDHVAYPGWSLTIKDTGGDASSNNITIDTEGAETIDGAASIAITTDYGYARVFADGSNWFTY